MKDSISKTEAEVKTIESSLWAKAKTKESNVNTKFQDH